MIVTDSIAEDLVVPEIKLTKPAEVSPMVIYVFLIGKGKLDSRQEQFMKQLNVLNSSHGGYSYFNTTLAEVSGEVLKFGDFMRNNMQNRHSNAWTSAFVDQTVQYYYKIDGDYDILIKTISHFSWNRIQLRCGWCLPLVLLCSIILLIS